MTTMLFLRSSLLLSANRAKTVSMAVTKVTEETVCYHLLADVEHTADVSYAEVALKSSLSIIVSKCQESHLGTPGCLDGNSGDS